MDQETEQKLARLEKRLAREKAAKKQAEQILEQKSLELFNSNQELKRLTVNLENRVAERTEELKHSRDEALKLANAKSEFLANMSHELRTPMNGVLGMLTLLKNTQLTNRQEKLVDTATNSGKLLLALINDILDLSKLEQENIALEAIPFDPAHLIQLTCEPFSLQAVAKGIELITLVQPDIAAQLQGDPTRIQQIITNLVSNAIKFTEQGEVLVSAFYESQNLVISVSDSGIGMTEAQINKVFEKFSQANESTTREFGGTGLGLAICKNLVSIMNGELSVHSTPNQGSCFEVRLPLALLQAAAPPTYSPNFTSQNVLLIFDNHHLMHFCESILHFWQFSQIQCAHSYSQAQQVMMSGQPLDLIIFDQRVQQTGEKRLEQLAIEHHSSAKLVSYWAMGSKLRQSKQHSMLLLPIKQSDLFDALVHTDTNLDKQAQATVFTSHKFYGSHVLLTEDNLINQEVARELLELLGCQVSIANNGQEAVEQVVKQHFDLVLMDIQMPVMDGITACNEIRKRGLTELPIVALTAHGLHGDREKSLEAGMDEHLTKPINLDALKSVLAQFLNESSTPGVEPEGLSDTKATAPVAGCPPDILDTAAGIDRLVGNTQLYIKVLADFNAGLTEQVAQLNTCLAQQDKEAFFAIAHTIKGSAANLSALQLQTSAANLEQVLQHGSFTNSNEQLMNALDEIHAAQQSFALVAEQFIREYSGISPNKPSKELNSKEIVCLANDISSNLFSDLALSEQALERLEQAALSEALSCCVKQIRHAFNEFDFTAIEQSCNKLVGESDEP